VLTWIVANADTPVYRPRDLKPAAFNELLSSRAERSRSLPLGKRGRPLRVTAENLANAESTTQTPGGDPYRRKTITFSSHLDRELGAELVEVERHGTGPTPFELRYEPGNPQPVPTAM
jgi:flagellar basal body rod protein FlgB